jgi:hypothetical protein
MTENKKIINILKHASECEGPKVTIALPTHKRAPENQKDKIVMKNLIQDAKKDLEKYPRRDWSELMDKIEKLLDNTELWLYADEGLMVLACGEHVETFKLTYSVTKSVTVGTYFHISPLFKLHAAYARPYIADISKDRVELYRVGENSAEKIDDYEIKTSFSDLFDDWDVDSNLNVGTYGGLNGIHHGHRTKSSESEKDREKYFRYLDHKFEEIHKTSGKRFIIAGTSDNVDVFSKLAQSDAYYECTIDHPLSSLSPNEIVEKTKAVLEPEFAQKKESINTDVRKAQNSSRFLDAKDTISDAALQGRISMLLYRERDDGYIEDIAESIIAQAVLTGADIAIFGDEIDIDHDMAAILR